jgi:hypothetical protein
MYLVDVLLLGGGLGLLLLVGGFGVIGGLVQFVVVLLGLCVVRSVRQGHGAHEAPPRQRQRRLSRTYPLERSHGVMGVLRQLGSVLVQLENAHVPHSQVSSCSQGRSDSAVSEVVEVGGAAQP